MTKCARYGKVYVSEGVRFIVHISMLAGDRRTYSLLVSFVAHMVDKYIAKHKSFARQCFFVDKL